MKDVTADFNSASKSEHVDLLYLVELDFDSGTSYLNTTDANITWSGHVYVGIGHLAEVSGIEETSELESAGFNGTLHAGVFAALALGEKFRGRPARVYKAYRSDGAIIPNPVLVGGARMDKMPLKLGQSGTVSLSCSNRIADWRRTNARRFTDAVQKASFPNDRGFEPVSQTSERDVPWGPTK